MARITIAGEKKQDAELQKALAAHTLVDSPDHAAVDAKLSDELTASDGYVMLPGTDPLVGFSVLVGKQYDDDYLDKPVVMYQPKGEENPFIKLVRDMIDNGMIFKQEHELFSIAETVDEITKQLESAIDHGQSTALPSISTFVRDATKSRPDVNICVLGSFSSQDQECTDMASRLGQFMHDKGWGLVYGGSDQGLFGTLARAVSGDDNSGYVKGIRPGRYVTATYFEKNKHDFIDELEMPADVFVRISSMTKASDAIVALPGGLGTSQEIVAMLRMKSTDPSQAHKPIILINKLGHFDGLIALLESQGYKSGRSLDEDADFLVVDRTRDTVPMIEASLKASARGV